MQFDSLIALEALLPKEYENSLVPEEIFTEAYETCLPKYRASLKTALSLATYQFKNASFEEIRVNRYRDAGFESYSNSKPYDWCAIVFDCSFAPPARLCAASILPILANVPCIFAIGLGQDLPLPAIATLELCGINDVFHIAYDQVPDFFAQIKNKCPTAFSGKICSLQPKKAQINFFYENLTFPICFLSANANIFVQEPDLFDFEVLAWAQNWQPKDYVPSNTIDCLFTSKKNGEFIKNASLILGPGYEGVWFFQNILPTNFMKCQLGFYMFEN